jgi:hypothetical protein
VVSAADPLPPLICFLDRDNISIIIRANTAVSLEELNPRHMMMVILTRNI